jgi:hypothetical protein
MTTEILGTIHAIKTNEIFGKIIHIKLLSISIHHYSAEFCLKNCEKIHLTMYYVS